MGKKRKEDGWVEGSSRGWEAGVAGLVWPQPGFLGISVSCFGLEFYLPGQQTLVISFCSGALGLAPYCTDKLTNTDVNFYSLHCFEKRSLFLLKYRAQVQRTQNNANEGSPGSMALK